KDHFHFLDVLLRRAWLALRHRDGDDGPCPLDFLLLLLHVVLGVGGGDEQAGRHDQQRSHLHGFLGLRVQLANQPATSRSLISYFLSRVSVMTAVLLALSGLNSLGRSPFSARAIFRLSPSRV